MNVIRVGRGVSHRGRGVEGGSLHGAGLALELGVAADAVDLGVDCVVSMLLVRGKGGHGQGADQHGDDANHTDQLTYSGLHL